MPQGGAAMRTGERLCGVLLAAGFVRRDAIGRVVRFRLGFGDAKRCAGGVEGLPAAAVGQDSEVADPVEAVGQDMGHEPGDERVGRDGLDAVPGLSLSGQLWPPAAEPHGLAVEAEDAAVADCDSMCVSRQVREDLSGSPERPLGEDDPVLAARPGQDLAEGVGIPAVAPEHDLAPVMGAGELLQEAAPEQAGQDLDGGEEPAAAGLPVPGPDVEAAVGDDAVEVGMPEEPLVPGMQHGGAADADAAPTGVGGDGPQRLGRGPEQDVEHGPAVREGDVGDLVREGEDDVEGGDRQDVPRPGLHPPAGGGALAGGAVAVPAGVVPGMLAAASLALVEMAAEDGGSARLDGGHDLEPPAVEPVPAPPPCGTGAAEDLRHAGMLLRHGSGVQEAEAGDRMVEGLEHLSRGAGVGACGVGVPMAEGVLDDVDAAAALMPVRGRAVPQGMEAGARVDSGPVPGGVERLAQGLRLDWHFRGLAVEQPCCRSWPEGLPIAAQVSGHRRGERRHAFDVPLAGTDVQELPVRLDVGDLHGDGLRDSETGSVCEKGRRPVAEVGRCQQQALDLHLRHVAGQAALTLPVAQAVDDVGTVDHLAVEEPQRGESGIGRGGRQAPVDQAQHPGAHLFRVEPVRSGFCVTGQVADGPQILVPRRQREVADAHLFDHSGAQGRLGFRWGLRHGLSP